MWDKVISVIAVLSAFAGAWLYIDTHYASAADMQRASKEFRLQILDLRKRQLNDTIFALEFKQNSARLSPLEKAQLEAAKRELQEISRHEAAAQRN